MTVAAMTEASRVIPAATAMADQATADKLRQLR
jgi:hypothetical protein